MSVLATVQGDLADALGEALACKSFDYIPERLIAPCVIVVPGSPWVTSGATFGTFAVSFDVDIVVQTAANTTRTKDLTDRVEEAIVTLVNDGYGVNDIAQPSVYESNGSQYMSATIQVTTTITL